jgi:uncharacterized protein (DUF1684 family)
LVTTRSDYIGLQDFRRRVARIYAGVRDGRRDPETRWQRFVRQRDDLFARHPLSALDADQKAVFRGLPYFPYNPAYRFAAELEPVYDDEILEYDLGEDGHFSLKRFARAQLDIPGSGQSLSLYWVQGYGGGIFLPFRDQTNGRGTYGGGRYLLDTVKGADLGVEGGRHVLDFNFAYNPSCAYNPRWICPLAPEENRLEVAVQSGEMEWRGLSQT